MNAEKLARIRALLSRIEHLDIDWMKPGGLEPETIGALRAEAFICAMDIDGALRRVDVPVVVTA